MGNVRQTGRTPHGRAATPRRRPARATRLLLLALLAAVPTGCNSIKLNPLAHEKPARSEKDQVPPLPNKYPCRSSQYVFLSDIELKPDQPLFKELGELRDQVYKELQLPNANTLVQVYIFEDRDRYERFMKAKYPDLPARRAFFVAQPRSVGGEDLLVYTYWGDRIQEDLRHELTHALLHSVLKDVPLWLDEGLAEYFELPPERRGVNYQHVDNLRRGAVQPNLDRLEQLDQVRQMTPAEYREAWAWVHLMLHGKPEAKVVLLNFLQQLRTNPNPGPMQPRLATVYASPETVLVQHLDELNAAKRTVPAAWR